MGSIQGVLDGALQKCPGHFPAACSMWVLFLCMAVALPVGAAAVSYEQFGAKGDGVADDLPAIVKAHAHANQHGLPVTSKPGATYHLGTRALTAIIATDTDWSTSRFIIDDSGEVEEPGLNLFEVRSLLKPVPLEIRSLRRGQKRLDAKPATECFVYVENRNRKLFIRRGLNLNDGSPQKEVFVVRPDGSIVGGIDWDYETVTSTVARPIDGKTLFLKGGVFTNIANRAQREGYWARGILVRRSNTVLDGITQRVTGEGKSGMPYRGFLSADRCARIMFRNCVIDGRKSYAKTGSAGKPVSMGTYGYHANLVLDFRMIGCRMGNDIMDRRLWGVAATNFMKDILIEGCELSRMDVHQGVSGHYTIRRTTLGHAGLNTIGRGKLIVEDSTLHGRSLINFRSDYGSTWDGTVLIRNSRWLPPGKNATSVMFEMSNDGRHDFGYPCSMPSVITIDGLTIGDAASKGIAFFGNPLGSSGGERPFPYRLTERITVKGIKTASGREPVVSTNAELTKALKVVRESLTPR